MRRIIFFALLPFPFLSLHAQETDDSRESALEELRLMEDDEERVNSWEEDNELYASLAASPVNLNTVTRERLESFPFLSDRQIEEITSYVARYGPLRSMSELMMIRSLDPAARRLLGAFVYIGAAKEDKPKIGAMIAGGRHELTVTARVPLYKRAGYSDGAYGGYDVRHSFRYNITYGDRMRIGLLGAQDSGEPFLAGKNALGYDHYSLYAVVRDVGPFETLALGSYRLSFGMGLVINQGFSLGKLSMTDYTRRSFAAIRANTSRTEGHHFQGAAATIRLCRRLSLTAFASYRSYDGTPAGGDTISNISLTGYHRTASELSRKGNTRGAAVGGNAAFAHRRFHLGATAVYTHLNRYLLPSRALYRRYYPRGTDFAAVAVDYAYLGVKVKAAGETAMDKDGHAATVNTLGLHLSPSLEATVIQRFYGYRFVSLYAGSFSDGGVARNESGVCLRLEWRPRRPLLLTVLGDEAYFPWARYGCGRSSVSRDLFASLSWSGRRWSLSGAWRARYREYDSGIDGLSVGQTTHRVHMKIRREGSLFSGSLSGDWVMSRRDSVSRGWMVSGDIQMKREGRGEGRKRFTAWAKAAYFSAASSRVSIYGYERGPLYEFSSIRYQGRGGRCAAGVTLSAFGLSLTVKGGVTDYFDRSVISSGHERIDSNIKADIDTQLRWTF